MQSFEFTSLRAFRISEIGIGLFILTVALMFIVPFPTVLIDLLITANLGFSFLLLLISLYVPSTLAILSLPSIILLSTLFRLGLNVASCRLVLSQGDAGRVIESFGTFLIRGEILIGVIIFMIITAVNYVVIAKGSTRVSEVAARFALDALPGRQLTIDSDLRAGLITAEEAQRKREDLRKESQLYGSMDGAMKFVQGDAIAGLVIIFVNAFGGIFMGLSKGMELKDAIQVYSTLTIGDGLVSQLPALLLSISAGMIVTRVSSSEKASLSFDIVNQIFSNPYLVVATATFFLFFSVLPGIPTGPFLSIGIFTILALLLSKLFRKFERNPSGRILSISDSSSIGRERFEERATLEYHPTRGDSSEYDSSRGALILYLDSETLYRLFKSSAESTFSFWERIRGFAFEECGISLPKIIISEVKDKSENYFALEVSGTVVEVGTVPFDYLLVEQLPEIATTFGFSVKGEQLFPFSGGRAVWLEDNKLNRTLLSAGRFRHLDALQFLILKPLNFYKENPEELIKLTDVHSLVKGIDKKYPGLLTDALNSSVMDVARFTEICHELVKEGVNVKDFKEIVEGVASYCSQFRSILSSRDDFERHHLVSFLRVQRKRGIIAKQLSFRRTLKAITLSTATSEVFDKTPVENGFAPLAIDPETLERLLTQLRNVFDPVKNYGVLPVVILCRSDLRSRVSNFLRGTESFLRAVSFDELDSYVEIEHVGVW